MIQYPWQTEGHTTWVPIASTHAGEQRGRLFTPEVGDEVAVRFEEGDPERPIVTSSQWNGTDPPPPNPFREVGGYNDMKFKGK